MTGRYFPFPCWWKPRGSDLLIHLFMCFPLINWMFVSSLGIFHLYHSCHGISTSNHITDYRWLYIIDDYRCSSLTLRKPRNSMEFSCELPWESSHPWHWGRHWGTGAEMVRGSRPLLLRQFVSSERAWHQGEKPAKIRRSNIKCRTISPWLWICAGIMMCPKLPILGHFGTNTPLLRLDPARKEDLSIQNTSERSVISPLNIPIA